MTYEEFKKQVHDRVLQEIDFSREILDEDVLRLIDGEITGAGRTRHISVREMKQLRQELFHSIRRLDVLQDLVDDPSVTEIMINGPEHIFIERDGILRDSGVRFATQERLEDVVQAIVAGCNRTVNSASPI
ncbi:MAG: CpaF family protein, partial [Lachnospiraceae bacterium]|nr:CpaF family protein [Lachnospiraceae bacterium]